MDDAKILPSRGIGACALTLAALFVAGCVPGSHESGDETRVGEDVAIPAAAAAAPVIDAAPDITTRRVVAGEFLVRFKHAESARASKILRSHSLTHTRDFDSIPDLKLVKALPGTADVAALARALAADPAIEYVEPNFIVHARAVPNDPEYFRQWPLRNTGQTGGSSPFFPDVRAESAWDITTGDAGVVVGVVDSGVDYTHVDLAANIFSNPGECDGDGIDDDANGHVDDCHGIDTVDNDSDPMDGERHGTHVAGTIGAIGNNGIGVAGVAWQVKILPCRFLNAQGEGTTAAAIACLDYLAMMKDRGVNLIASNHSWGGGEHSRALADAIVAHRQRGMLIVAAAGNDSRDVDVQPDFPCAYDLANVICVAASYESILGFSSYGSGTVHLAAPGTGIWSTVPGNQYDAMDGTSMAAPHVTAALVLLKAQNPARDWRALRNLVIAGTVLPREYSIPTVTAGRLELPAALGCANSVVLGRLRPSRFETLHRPIGGVVTIRAIHVNCAAPNGNVAVSVIPSGQIVTLRDDGVAPDEATGDGIYAAQWTATTAGTFHFSFPSPESETFSVHVDEMLEPGFPLSAYTRTSFDDAPGGLRGPLAIGNLDADAELEIVAGTLHFGPILVANADGSLASPFPLFDNLVFMGLSLAQLDADPSLEIVTNNYLGGINAYDGDATLMPGWPPMGGTLVPDLPPPVFDLDGDGRDEVITYPARRADGSAFRSDVVVPATTTGPVGMLVVGDLDADGRADIVSPGGGISLTSLLVSDRDGIKPGFPVPMPADVRAEGDAHLLIGDVDGDGTPNIILPSFRRDSSSQVRSQIAIFSNRGRLLRTIITDQGSIFASLADLDGDGFPEIIRATGEQLHAWKGDGTEAPGWPADVVGGDFFGTTHPVVGDIDGDGRPDVIVGTRYAGGKGLYAIRHDGTTVAGFPKNFDGEGGSLNTPAIADIDLDGRNEVIVAATTGNGLRESIFVFDTHAPGPHGPLEWPQFMGGASRLGYYESGKNLPNHAILATQVYGAGRIVATGIDCGTDCVERLAKGTTRQLQAVAATGATFAQWRGACAGQGNPCTLTVSRLTETSADFDSTVTVAITGAGSVTSNVAGIQCPADCSERFPARTTVTLTAAAASAADFAGWTGACSGSAATCTVFIDDVKQVGAAFTAGYPLTISKSGAGSLRVTSAPAGIDCGAQCSAEFAVRSTVHLSLLPAADTYVVSSGLGCNQTHTNCQIVMDAARTVAFVSALKPVVHASVVGQGRMTSDPAALDCTTQCDVPLAPGLVTFRAVPVQGWHFVRWTGLCTGSGNISSCNHMLSGDVSVGAEFALDPVLTVDHAGTGAGTVSSADAGFTCATSCARTVRQDGIFRLVATAGAGSTFSGWSGACSGTGECTITASANASVTATFTRNAGSPSGGGGGKGGGGALGLESLAFLCAALAGLSRRARRSTPAVT